MKEEHIYSEEELNNILEFGEVLRGIHNRLLAEGKIKVVNGKIVPMESEGRAMLKRSRALRRQLIKEMKIEEDKLVDDLARTFVSIAKENI